MFRVSTNLHPVRDWLDERTTYPIAREQYLMDSSVTLGEFQGLKEETEYCLLIESKDETSPSTLILIQDLKNQATFSATVNPGDRRWVQFHGGLKVMITKFGPDNGGFVRYQVWKNKRN